MAAERMPDFKEINRLIESLQMLDRSFQRITSEYGEHEANVRKACTAELKKQSAEFLKEIPVRIPRPESGSTRFKARGITRCMISIKRRTGNFRELTGSARSRSPRSEALSGSF